MEEVKRIRYNTNARFYEPKREQGNGKKIEHLRILVKEKVNIVMTHELFARMDKEIVERINNNEYTLIMDEVTTVFEEVMVTKGDINILVKSKLIEIDEDDKIRWRDVEYDGVFNELKEVSINKNLYLHNGCKLFSLMPVKYFTTFKEVFILTYLFEGQTQRCYFDLFNLEYKRFSVVNNLYGRYELIDHDRFNEPREAVKELLIVFEDYRRGKSSLNSNFMKNPNKKKYDNYRTALSINWFDKADESQIEQLNRNLVNFLRRVFPTSNDKIFWTCPKKYAPLLKNCKTKYNKNDDRLKDNFIPFNTRATNNYSHCTAAVFVFNRFINPNEKQFFEYRGIEVKEDLLALSDLIQFLFRGCIRNGEEMSCYIPSERMRNLLYNWLKFEE